MNWGTNLENLGEVLVLHGEVHFMFEALNASIDDFPR
jgi:hypothetical protein